MKPQIDPVRKKIKKIENSMMKQKAELAKLRRRAKPELVSDYALLTLNGKTVKLSALFGGKKELIVVHNMGSSCPYCTLWADGFDGLAAHLENRAAFVVESPDRPKTMAAFRKRRSWNLNMVSSRESEFRKDMGYAGGGGPTAGISAFVKKGGKIYRVSDTEFGPGDNFCSMWDVNDLLPKSDWGPEFRY